MASPAELSRLTWWRRPRRLYILQYNCSSGSHHPPKSKYSKLVALALLPAGMTTTGDAHLFGRLGGFSGGVRSLSCSCPLIL